jgi:hypothetical protein
MAEINEITQLKLDVCKAGKDAARELIKIAKTSIVSDVEDKLEWETDENGDRRIKGLAPDDEGLTADKLTRAAQAKKICIMDAFEILTRCEEEENRIRSSLEGEEAPTGGFAETRAKKRT